MLPLRPALLPVLWALAAPCLQLAAQDLSLDDLTLSDLTQVQVVSASRKGEDLFDVAAAVDVLTADDIHRSVAQTLPGLMRDAWGLHVGRYTGRDWSISARGFNDVNAYNLEVLQDGRSLYTPLYSGVFWDVQDTLLSDLDRVEVVRGPAATMWGPNAVSGVINIYTKPASRTQGLLLSTSAATQDDYVASARYGFEIARNTWMRVYGKYITFNDIKYPDKSDATLDPWEMGRTGFRLDSSAIENNSLMVEGELYSDMLGYQVANPYVQTRGWYALARDEYTLSPTSSLTLQTSVEGLYRNFPNALNEWRRTWDTSLQYLFQPAERHEMVAGVQYRRSWDDTKPLLFTQFTPNKKVINLFDVYAQDQWELVESRLYLIGGLMLLNNTYSDWDWQPTIRLRYEPSPTVTLWTAASRAVRIPTRIDEEFDFTVPNAVEIRGNTGYQNEATLAYEVGARWQPAQQVFLDVDAFYNHHENLRTTEPIGSNVYVFDNNLAGRTYGLEAKASWRPFYWLLTEVNGSWLQEDFHLVNGSTDTSAIHDGKADPRLIGRLRLAFDLAHNIQIDTYLRYTGSIDVPAEPAWWGLDARVSWAPNDRWELSLVGTNLTDDQHPETSEPSVYQRQVARSLYAKVTIRY